MILEEGLKQLQVAVKGGGNLVSHRAVFSDDSSKLYVIQSSKLLTYSTATGLLLSKYTTPGATSIANIHCVEDEQVVLIFTTAGQLLRLNVETNQVVSTRSVNLSPKKWTPIANFINFVYPSETTASHFFAVGYPEDNALPVLYAISNDDELSLTKLCWSVVPTQHSVGVGRNGRFVVAIQESSLYCKDMSVPTECRWHSAGTRKFTCVAVHPTNEFVCATGDDSGRVLVWNNVMTGSPAKTVFHWHTLPVSDLAFTPEGSQIVTGGGECTMVKWDVSDSTSKRTLPRMGLPIRHLNVSRDGDFIAVGHADNCIQLVDPYNNIVAVVKNITQSCVPEVGEHSSSGSADDSPPPVFPAGVNVDPNNHCLVMNGRPGWLQCYSFKEDKHLYTLDISQQNYVTAERHKQIPNSEVTHVAFSKNGGWMAAAEARRCVNEDEEQSVHSNTKCMEVKIKFWKFDAEKQKYVLNTCIDWPHECELTSLRIQPVPETAEGLIAASSGGEDMKFKIWGLISDPSIHGKSEWWYCEKTGMYKDLPAGPLCFSTDGSMMAASFGRTVTLWDTTEDCDFKLSLCHQRLTDEINILEFGQNVSSHLVLCCTRDNLIVWDVITASLLWVAPVQVDSLAVDPMSNLAAAATSSFHVLFFTPDNPLPVAVHKNVSKSQVVSSVFVPNHKQMENLGLKSTLVFVNKSQELCAMLPKEFVDEQDGDILRIRSDGGGDTSALTPFAQMVAQKTVSLVGADSSNWGNRHHNSGHKAYSILRDIMDASPHTMPSVTYYCSQLLRTVSKPSSEMERLSQMEQAMRSTAAKRVGKKTNQPLNDSLNSSSTSVDDSNNNNDSLRERGVDLDSALSEDTCWIQNVFK